MTSIKFMGKALLHFKKPGLQTLIQDDGRMGHQAYGVPIGGSMDKSSAHIANWLTGNNLNSPVIEMAFVGPEIEIKGACQIALTGAEVQAKLNGYPINMYETIDIKSHSKLVIGPTLSGSRTYLSVGGKWNLKQWLGSYSAFLLGDEILTADSIIKKDGDLEISSLKKSVHRKFPVALRPQFPDKIAVGMIPGPEQDMFSEKTIEEFLEQYHPISSDSNRMGYRLNSTVTDFNNSQEVISSGIVPGTIQITNSGEPIILMADAQTTGGYPRIGNVISAHMDRLAQAKPGDRVKFFLTNCDDAQLALKDLSATLNLALH